MELDKSPRAVQVLADSVAPTGCRLTTFLVTFPRIILAEVNTHRILSRNSASSRAIPVEKMIRMVREQPYVPQEWGRNQKGMQAEHLLEAREASKARDVWLQARDHAVAKAEALLDLGVHKQLTNRLLEPFMWHTAIITSTEWDNFFHLRNHRDAHPDFQLLAAKMQLELGASTPERFLDMGAWHLPLVTQEEIQSENGEWPAWEVLVKVSVGRCARVSYLTHAGTRDFDEDVALHDRLLAAGHLSPFEHVAHPLGTPEFSGNFRGWRQYRKKIPREWDILG